MSLQLITAKCCAIQEINGLSTFASAEGGRGAELTMAAFCQMNLRSHGQVHYRGFKARPEALYSFYFFSGPVYHTTRWDHTTPWETDAYVDKFARFIEEHQLGELTKSPLKVNAAFHVDHANQMYIWSPDVKALKKWWEQYQKDHAKELNPGS